MGRHGRRPRAGRRRCTATAASRGFDVGNPNVRFNNFYSPYPDVNFQNGDPTKWVDRLGDRSCRTSGARASAFYMPEIDDPVDLRARSSRACSTSGGRRTTAATRRTSRRTAPSSRRSATRRAAATSCRSATRRAQGVPGSAERPDRVRPYGTDKTGRLRRRDRARAERHVDAVGSDPPRPRVHLAERGRALPARSRSRGSTPLGLAARRPLRQRASSSTRRTRTTRTSRTRRLQRDHADARPGHVFEVTYNPKHGHGDVDVARQRHGPARRPAGHRPRARPEHEPPLRRDRLRRPRLRPASPGNWRPAAAGHADGRGLRPDARLEEPRALRGDARPRDLVAAAARRTRRRVPTGTTKGRPRAALRRSGYAR